METKPMELDTSRLHGRHEEEPPNPLPFSPPVVSGGLGGGSETPQELAVPLTTAQIEEVRQALINELHHCFDPEIPVNIYELGLIYAIDIQPDGAVHVDMTLTSPACPVAGSLPGDVKARLRKVANVTAVAVDVVWEPPWDKDRMSEAAKLQLGIDD